MNASRLGTLIRARALFGGPLSGLVLAALLGLATGCTGREQAEREADAAGEQRLAAQQAEQARQAQTEAEALAMARAYTEAQQAGGAASAEAAKAELARSKAMAEEAQRQALAQAQADAIKTRTAAETAAAAARQQAEALALAQAQAQAKVEAQAKAEAQAKVEAQTKAAAQTKVEAKLGANVPAQAVAPSNAPFATAPPPVATTDEDYSRLVAEIRTSQGVMVLSFRPDKAPNHVKNFVDLARRGFYDGLTFHKVVPGDAIQAGDPKGDGSGGPGYFIKNEFNDLPHVRGTLSMARAAHPDTAGSQFFICVAPRPDLDGKYTVFGKLIEGEDTLDRIAALGSPGGTPRETIRIEKVLIRPATPKG